MCVCVCVQVIIANVIVIALSSTPHTAAVVPYLALFLLFYVVELTLRVLAEDVPGDFWAFSRLHRMQPELPHRAMALRFDIVVVVATVIAFVATRVVSVRGIHAQRRTRTAGGSV